MFQEYENIVLEHHQGFTTNTLSDMCLREELFGLPPTYDFCYTHLELGKRGEFKIYLLEYYFKTQPIV